MQTPSSMTGKRPSRLQPGQSVSVRNAGFLRSILIKTGAHKIKIRLPHVFVIGFLGGVFVELFKMHVAVKGQTYYDFVERKDARQKWDKMGDEEKRGLLIKYGKEHLIESTVGV